MIGLSGISFIIVTSYLYIKVLSSSFITQYNSELEEEDTQTQSNNIFSRYVCKSRKRN